MIWLAFTIAFLSVCLGYAFAVFVAHRPRSAAAGEDDGQTSSSQNENPEINPGQARAFLEQLQELAVTVDGDVDRHNTRVQEITGELSNSSRNDPSQALAAAKKLLEANNQLQKDLSFAKQEIRLQRQQLNSYMAEARTDELTGLANRRAFNEELRRRFAQLQRQGTPLSLLLADVDHFKKFNDRHGHQVGDGMLQGVAHAMTRTVREMDMVTRYGGEEFAVILPGTTLEEAKVAAERVRTAVAEHRFVVNETPLQITVSIGIAEGIPAEGPEELTKRSDAALYAAKECGRNRSCLHDGEGCELIEPREQKSPGTVPTTLHVAPFVDGKFLEWSMFREVTCREMSPAGFAFVVPDEPDYEQVMIAMGSGHERSCTTAVIEERLPVGSEDDPQYLIRCRFTSRTNFKGGEQDSCDSEAGSDLPIEAASSSAGA